MKGQAEILAKHSIQSSKWKSQTTQVPGQHAAGSSSASVSLPQPSETDLVVDDQLGFSKDRCISRLTEMQSLEYLIAHAEKHAPHLLLALQQKQAADKAKATA